MTERLHLRLSARIASLTELDESIEEFGLAQGWDAETLFQSRLVLEELATNIITHGFGALEGARGYVEIDLISEPGRVRMEVSDDSWAFNPLDAKEVDVNAPMSDRGVGGLGVHFVRSMMDEVRYSRENGRNRVVLVKNRPE